MILRFLIYLLFLKSIVGLAQTDTIKTKNDFILFGEIKKIDKGVLNIETPYSDSDFKVDFNEISYVVINKPCVVILTNGRRRTGYIRSEQTDKISIFSKEHQKEIFNIKEIIRLEIYEDLLWKRFSANIDLGFNLTKANNANQLTASGGLYYKGPTWIFNSDINILRSQQDDTQTIERTNSRAELMRVFLKRWFVIGSVGYLSNTQQALDSRYNAKLGAGRYLITNNKLFLGLSLGLNYNVEDFTDVSETNNSAELFLSSTLNLFNFSDVDLITGIDIYPSLSEKDRLRLDYMLDARYKLPLDFYVKAGVQFNYDNQTTNQGSDFDYIFTTGFGWKFN